MRVSSIWLLLCLGLPIAISAAPITGTTALPATGTARPKTGSPDDREVIRHLRMLENMEMYEHMEMYQYLNVFEQEKDK